MLAVVAADCTCPGPYDMLKWVDNESKLGASSVDTCSGHDDDNSWFTALHYDDDAANPTMQYRYCERKYTQTVGNSCTSTTYSTTWKAKYVTKSYEDTPTCGDWKEKTIPDNTNFRAFYDEGVFEWERDSTCGTKYGSYGNPTYCSKIVGPPDHVALAYSKTGTVCFRYNLEECDEISQYCWGTSQHKCDSDSCETQCYTLTDSKEVHTLSFISYGNTPVYYVEIAFNNKDIKKQVDNGGSTLTTMMTKKSYLHAISFLYVSYFFFF